MSFAHSLRDSDFERNTLDEVCRWFLAFDHTIFSRWLPNHVNDLVMWFSVHFDIFVVQRSIDKFYLMDQSHEHSNRYYKVVVVAYQICMTISTDYIALYMLAAPDFLTFINEFESVQNPRNSSQRISISSRTTLCH